MGKVQNMTVVESVQQRQNKIKGTKKRSLLITNGRLELRRKMNNNKIATCQTLFSTGQKNIN